MRRCILMINQVSSQLKESSNDSQTEIAVGQLQIRYLKDGAKSGQMGAFELTVPPGSNVPPPHSHILNEEYLYILEGKLRHFVDGVTKDLVPGEGIFTPKGAVHGFSNPFTDTVRALVVLSPDVGANYFLDVAEVLSAGGPPDREKLITVMANYGLVPAAPAKA